MTPPAVLVLDDDLGFCMWLGRILNQAGIRALPASRGEEALAVLADPGYNIELIVVNPQIEGCADVLRQSGGAKVMAIGEAGNLAVQGTIQRPQGRSLPAPELYVNAVRQVLGAGAIC